MALAHRLVRSAIDLGTGALLCGSLLAAGCGLVVVERDRYAGEGGGGGSFDSTGAGWAELGCTDSSGTGDDPQARAIGCFPRPQGEDCPSIYEATLYIAPSRSCAYVVSVDCGPRVVGATCCYIVTEEQAACN